LDSPLTFDVIVIYDVMTQHSKRREDWQRITLRLPPDLYHDLIESAHDHRQSLNSRIMEMLLQNDSRSEEVGTLGRLRRTWEKLAREVERELGEPGLVKTKSRSR
jgi:hypothetical protein